MLNLATIIEMNARNHPDRPAFICGSWRLTHHQLNEEANRVANGLRAAGVRPGQTVALICPTNPFFPICYFGVLKMGGVVAPLNNSLKSAGFEKLLRHSDAVAVIAHEGTARFQMGREAWAAWEEIGSGSRFWWIPATPQEASPPETAALFSDLIVDQSRSFETEQRQADDTCSILYTSGTTGAQKGAELTHNNVLFNSMVTSQHWKYRPDDVLLISLPLFHSFGQTVLMNPALIGGATVVLLPVYSPGAVWEAMAEHGVTVFGGVPTMYWDLYNYPKLNALKVEEITGKWRALITGGTMVPNELVRCFKERFQAQISTGYGLSETAAVVTFEDPSQEKRPRSIGRALWSIEVRVVDEAMQEVPRGQRGELVIRGHHVMKGYYKNEEATKEAFRGGWFHSGDLGKMDEDGYLYIDGRIKDIIIRGGENINPADVEEVLITHPAVSLVSVIGVPDDRLGEEVKAYIVLEEGASATAEEIIAWSKKLLPSYQYPRHVEFLDALPVGPSGKPVKTALRKLSTPGNADVPVGIATEKADGHVGAPRNMG